MTPFYTHLVLRGPTSCNHQLITINFQELRSHMTHLTKCNGGQNVISPLAITSYRLCCLLCWAAKLALHVICSLHQSRIEVGLPEPRWCCTMLVFQFLNRFQFSRDWAEIMIFWDQKSQNIFFQLFDNKIFHQSRMEVGLPELRWCCTMLVLQILNCFQSNFW